MRRLAALGTALALVMSVWLVMPAAALAPSLHFTADALPTWQTNGTVWGMASAQGKVFAGGSFTQVRPPGTAEGDPASLNRAQLVVLDAVTGTPTSCVIDVTRGTSTAIVRAVTTSPDQSTVYIGGLFETVKGTSRRNVAAIDVATCTVKPFNPQPSSFVYALAATADTLYFGGNFASAGGQPRSRLGAASVTSTVTGAVLPWAPTTDDEVFALAVDPNTGNVIIGGRSGTINGQDSHALGVVDGVTGTTNIHNYPKGFFPWSPGTGQRAGTSVVKTIAVDATGFYVGNEGTGGGIFDGRAAFNWGTYEQRWRNLCLGATQSIAPVDGLLYSASHGHNCEAEGIFEDGARHFFSAETASDKQVQAWWPQADNGIGEGIGPRSIIEASTASGDYLWSGGEFTQINGVPQRGLTHFAQGPDTGAPATPQTPNVSSTTPGQVVVTWRTTLDDDDKNLTYTLYRGTSATPIATLQADSQFYARPQLSFTDTGLTPGQSYSYRVKASDGTNVSAYSLSRTVTVTAIDAAYPSKIRSDGATVYFRMEEPNGTAAGSLGSGSQGGSYVNASTRTDQDGALLSNPGTSALFDGVSSFVRTEVAAPAPTVYTIESWIKTTTTRGGKIVGYGNRAMMNGVGTTAPLSAGGKYDRQIYMTNDGKLTFGTNTPFTTISSAAAYNDGQWHQVVASQGPAGMALYVDGARVAKNTVTTNGSYSGFWRIGGDTIAGYPNRPLSDFFGGNIDETAIYEKVLTPQQVADHYRLSGRTNPLVPAPPTDNYGAAVNADGPDLYWRLGEATGTIAVDTSNNNSTGTYAANVTRSVPSGVAGTADTAITTTGAATGIVYAAGSAPSPATFSEELWFKTATTTGGKLIGYGNSANGSSTQYDKHIYMGTDGRLRFGVNSGGLQVITSPNAYNNNAWHHVVTTQDASGTKLYVDGALVASGATTGNQSFTGFWRVGGDNLATWPNRPTTDYFTGSIDEVAVYSKALTAAQVQSHFALGVGTPAPDTQAPTVPGGVAAAATGSTVALSWTASTDNVGVTKYEVHRSATDGFTADASTKIADVTSGTTYSDANLAAGTWYYRVDAVDAAGNASAASAAASAVVAPPADTQVPVAPTTVGATVANQDVSLSWSGATDNVGVTGYEVHRSATSGFTPSSATKIGTVSGSSFTDTVVTGGTWFYKVIAVDAAGNQSLPSAEASAVVAAPADTTAPTVPTALQANVSGTTVALTWTASTDAVGVAGYDVYRSATAGFTADATTKIGTVASGTTFSDAARPVGTWVYKVIARDAAGNASAASSEASAVVSGGAVQTVVLSPTEDTYAVQGTPTTSYGTSTSMNSRGGSSSFAPYLKFTLPVAPAGTSLVGAALSVRTTTDAAAGSVDSHVVSLSGASSWTEAALTWNNRPAVGTTVGSFAPPTVPNTRYSAIVDAAALAALPAGAVTLAVSSTSTDNFQFWSQNFATATYRPTLTLTYQPTGGSGDTQVPVAPTTVGATVANQDVSLSWSGATDNVGVTGYEVHRSATSGFTPSSATKIGTVSGSSFTDTVVTGGTWFYKVIAVDAAGNQSLPSAEASAVVAAPADTTAPTVPTALQANVSGTTVALTWTASTDAVGVAGYDVYRSATAGFTADGTTKIGTVASGTTFSDAARPVGTWVYKVIARDAAGNASAASSEASAVVSGGAVQTVVLSPTEDTYAVQGTPTTSYGTSTSMNSRGGSSSFAPYLKFTLPVAPAGTSLVGAALSVRTTTDAAAGSVDSHVVSLSGASSWTEAALTWNNRPAVGTTVGSFAPPTVPNTRYSAIVDAAALAALPAGAVTLAVSSTSTDNFQFWSQNFATATYRPTLTLTYQAN